MRLEQDLAHLYHVTGIPLTLLDGKGKLVQSWPDAAAEALYSASNAMAIADFRLRERDRRHPLIRFIDPGYLLGVVELEADRYLLIGHVSPTVQTHDDVLKLAGESIHPAHLQEFCDMLLNRPLVSLEKMKDLIHLLMGLLGESIAEEDILFVDNVSRKLGTAQLDRSLFEQREAAESHVPVDFETAICAAIETGDRVLLERGLYNTYRGRVGRMSQNDLRQQKYTFICMATLASRAAIRGGLDAETSFNLSDFYCQRADLLGEIPPIQDLTFTMLTDFCGRVREIKKLPCASPLIQNCLNYISVHLHEPITLELLSAHCGLCTRSLSLRFREETGMGVPEYVHREKLREAEYLLLHTDYSLSKITSYLNYANQSYFTQIFKKYKGQTPQQYRDQQK